MTDIKQEKVEVVEHKNIFEALSAFQGENPEIKQTKTFGKEGDKMHFTYAPLDEILKTVRPALAKHGLAVTFGGNDKGEMVCSLYHTTYKIKETDKPILRREETITTGEIARNHYVLLEEGVIRSAPIKVKRDGEMKAIGSDSTYARRYQLCEVLGIASDEDKDVSFQEQAKKNVESLAFRKLEEAITSAKKEEDVIKQMDFIKKEIAIINEGKKAPQFGLPKDKYEKLLVVGENALAKLRGELHEDTGEVAPSDLPEDLK